MSIIKQAIILVIIAAVGAGGFYGYQHYAGERGMFGAKTANGKSKRRRSGDRVEVVEVKYDRIRDTIEAVGTTRAFQAISVVALASGRVVEITAAPGQEVKKGDPIIRLDDDIEKANLEEAKAKLLKARSFLDRSRTLRESKFASQAVLDQMRADAASAAAEVGRAERRLADRVIRAAFGGRVGLNKVEVGARVDSNTVLTTLDDVSKVEIEFQLPEVVFGRTKVGMPVVATGVAFPGEVFKGTIAHVDTRVDRNSRTFLVRARLPNPDRKLPAGMFMRLSLILDERQALVASEETVVAEGGESFVFVVDADRVRKRKVRIGQRRPGIVEFKDGVKAGEIVVSRGLARLRDGKRIRVVGGSGAKRLAADRRGEGRGGKKPGKVMVAEGAIAAIKQNGRRVVWRLKDGKEVEFRVSGKRTRITIDGKSASRDGIKMGMLCKATADKEGQVAETIDCKQKSGA